MKTLRELALLALCSLPVACRSSGSAARGDRADEVPCTCGQPMTSVEGCAHSACMSGQGTNAGNPDCVCGTLSIPK